jgi:hypothetical protein
MKWACVTCEYAKIDATTFERETLIQGLAILAYKRPEMAHQ